MSAPNIRLGLVGGSGVEQWPDARLVEKRSVETPYGAPSAELQQLELGGTPVWFLSRHGVGHDIAPHAINYRANIQALSDVGVSHLIALNAVGIIGHRVRPGALGLPDQIIDYTWGRETTFFDGLNEPLQHTEFGEPFCPWLREQLLSAAKACDIPLGDGGVYAVTQGPRLETAAEVDRLERDGAEFIGMTAMPEAVLAAERGISYASVALVVNEAAGRGHGAIHAQLAQAMEEARGRAAELVLSFANQIG
ncbi:MAG: S-methyl-5'-thioinosine phosphorylase [Pseudomonadota bacterium]